MTHPGTRFREALAAENPLRIVGTLFPVAALMAQEMGFRAAYLSGGGVANTLYGVPDTGLTTLENVAAEARKITANPRVNLPLLVDIDTGWGDPAQAVAYMEEMGVAAVHIEDQLEEEKRCGHLEGKQIVSTEEMCARIKASVSGRTHQDFFIIARTDALSVEGPEATLARAQAYAAAGADGLFIEAVRQKEDFLPFTKQLPVPVLANITEFGKTPLYRPEELKEVGVRMALFPRGPERAMLSELEAALENLAREGSLERMVESGRVMPRKNTNKYLAYDAPVEQGLDERQTKEMEHER